MSEFRKKSNEYLWNPITLKQALPSCFLGEQCFGNRISIDSRTTQKFDIFVALKGVNTDGHKHLLHAFEKGASCALVEYIPEEFESKNIPKVFRETNLILRATAPEVYCFVHEDARPR